MQVLAHPQFSFSAVDQQCGAMPILKRMMELDPSVRFEVRSTRSWSMTVRWPWDQSARSSRDFGSDDAELLNHPIAIPRQ